MLGYDSLSISVDPVLPKNFLIFPRAPLPLRLELAMEAVSSMKRCSPRSLKAAFL